MPHIGTLLACATSEQRIPRPRIGPLRKVKVTSTLTTLLDNFADEGIEYEFT